MHGIPGSGTRGNNSEWLLTNVSHENADSPVQASRDSGFPRREFMHVRSNRENGRAPRPNYYRGKKKKEFWMMPLFTTNLTGAPHFHSMTKGQNTGQMCKSGKST